MIYFCVCIWLQYVKKILMFMGNYRYHSLSESLLYKLRDQTDSDKFSDKCFAIWYSYYLYMKLRNKTDTNNTESFSMGTHCRKFLYPYFGNE